jgi:hypothetical protein
MWHDCAPALQQACLAQGRTLPNPRVRANGREIEQIHPITCEVVQRFSSVAHVEHTMQIARASLFKAIEDGARAKAYRWRFAGVDVQLDNVVQ